MLHSGPLNTGLVKLVYAFEAAKSRDEYFVTTWQMPLVAVHQGAGNWFHVCFLNTLFFFTLHQLNNLQFDYILL